MERIFVWNHQDEKKKLAAQEVRKRHRANKKSNKPATPETWQEVLLRQTDLPPWKRNLRVFLLEAVEDAQAAISLFKQLSPAKLFKLPDIHKKLPYDTPETRGRRTPLHPPMRAMAAAEARNNGNLEAGVELTNRDVFKRPKYFSTSSDGFFTFLTSSGTPQSRKKKSLTPSMSYPTRIPAYSLRTAGACCFAVAVCLTMRSSTRPPYAQSTRAS